MPSTPAFLEPLLIGSINRAKTIKNQAKVNKEMSVQELKALLDKANKEISRLKTYCTCLEEELRLVKGTLCTILNHSPLLTNVRDLLR